MTAINNKIKPYSIRSLLYWNGFEKVDDYVYRKQCKKDNSIIEIDYSNFYKYITITSNDSYFGRTQYTLKPYSYVYTHHCAYTALLGWITTNLGDAEIPNFDRHQRVLYCKCHFNENKVKRWIEYQQVILNKQALSYIKDMSSNHLKM